VTGRATTAAEDPPTLELLREYREEIVQISADHGAYNVRVFGSVARRTALPSSDIDLLFDFEPGRTLRDQVGLWRDLESLLGRSVDVVSAGGLTTRDDDIRADALVL
jgi:hypothetical protein